MVRKGKGRPWIVPALAGLSLVGCVWSNQRQGGRTVLSKKAEPEPVVTFAEESSGSNDSAPPKGFFKNTHLPGALSSEGAEIERNLGIGR